MYLPTLLILLLTGINAVAQTGIKGIVTNQQKEPLAYASVSVRGTSIGTIANEEGQYQLNLKPGYYEIVFQYLGYQAGMKTLTVSNQMEVFDVVMAEQALQLGEVRVGKGNEDPAYAIMRRAIGKSRYHLLQIDSYKARAYTKSSFVIIDLPLEFLYKKELEKIASQENFKKGVPILNETVSDIEFKQPNIYKQKVIAARNSQDNSLANPNEYLLSSFYRPDVVQTVSPLSPKAFGYYKFEYLGTFRENGVDVSKIKVIPRAYGDGVFKGTIHIIEDLWAIHSLDLQTVKMGISLKIKQTYGRVEHVWVPIQQQFYAEGGLYGVKAKAEFVISQTFQSIKLNPDFPPDIVVLDSKQDKEEIKSLPLVKKEIQNKGLNDLLTSGKKLSAKSLRKAIRKYEKQQFEESKTKGEDVDFFERRVSSTEIDSLATQRDHTFWDSLRTVPLTRAEIISYNRLDSLATIKSPERVNNSDTAQNPTRHKSNRFDWGGIFWGKSLPLTKKKSLRFVYTGPIRGIQVNTVEGLVVDGVSLGFKHARKASSDNNHRGHQISVRGILRYSLERNKLSPRGEARYHWGRNTFSAEGGRTISQFNPDNPISFLLNSATTLFFEQNFAKIYQKDYLRFNYTYTKNNDHFKLSAYTEYADRAGLVNSEKMHRYRWVNWRRREFTPNSPKVLHSSQPKTHRMPTHRILTAGLSISYKPWQKYRITGGKTIYYKDDSPELMISYRKGIPELSDSESNFDFVSFRVKHGFSTGIRSKLYYQVNAGAFLNNRSVAFPDFHHFAGNRFLFQFGDPVGTFRMLDYYRYSTDQRFVEGHMLAEFRQLLFTQIQWFRLLGIKETFLMHFLATPRPDIIRYPETTRPPTYTELGYGFDVGIRFPFRVEVINNFEGLTYKHTAFRIGTTMNLPFQ